MIFGLGAAVAWGLADFGAALVGRRIGSVATTILSQLAGAATVAVLFLAAIPALDASMLDVAVLLANGFLMAGAYLIFYRGLQLGPIALVSPIVAAYGGVTIPLALLVLGESLSGIEVAAAAVTIGGVVLAATDLRRLRSGEAASRGGIPFAIMAMLMYGVGAFVMGRYAQEVGWLLAVAISRVGSTAALVALALSREGSLGESSRKSRSAAALVGVVDSFGVIFFSWGAESGMVSIVAAASATFTLIPIAGGLILFKERPAPSQVLGVALVVGGLLALALA